MEGPILFWGYKEQESNLILPEHDDDDCASSTASCTSSSSTRIPVLRPSCYALHHRYDPSEELIVTLLFVFPPSFFLSDNCEKFITTAILKTAVCRDVTPCSFVVEILTIWSHLRPLTSRYYSILKMGAEDSSETKYLRHYMAIHPRRQWFPKSEIISNNHALRVYRLRSFGISRSVE